MGRDIIDVYDRSIFEMRNVFTAEECQTFIDYHKNSPNKKAGTTMSPQRTHTVNKTLKISTDIVIDDPEDYFVKRYIEGLNKVHMEYTKHLSDIDRECGLRSISLGYPSALRIQRTDKGNFFNWHSDYHDNRLIAVITYLNDIDEENGGSTEFNSGRKVQPETGKVLMFPTTDLHLHRGNTILNGHSKYIISGFILDPNIETQTKNITSHTPKFPFIFK
jgi:hypothetical protein